MLTPTLSPASHVAVTPLSLVCLPLRIKPRLHLRLQESRLPVRLTLSFTGPVLWKLNGALLIEVTLLAGTDPVLTIGAQRDVWTRRTRLTVSLSLVLPRPKHVRPATPKTAAPLVAVRHATESLPVLAILHAIPTIVPFGHFRRFLVLPTINATPLVARLLVLYRCSEAVRELSRRPPLPLPPLSRQAILLTITLVPVT